MVIKIIPSTNKVFFSCCKFCNSLSSVKRKRFIRGWDDFYNHVLIPEVYTLSIGKVLSIKALAEELIEKSHSKSKIEIIGLRKGDTLEDPMMNSDDFKPITDFVSEVFE